MKRRTRATGVAGLALALALLPGCASGGNPANDAGAGSNSDRLYERTITLTDGRTITCVVHQSGNAGGVSCDWDGAR